MHADLEAAKLVVGAVRTVDFPQTFLESIHILMIPIVVVEPSTHLTHIRVTARTVTLVVRGPCLQHRRWWGVGRLALRESADTINTGWSVLLELATISILDKRVAAAAHTVVVHGKGERTDLSPAHLMVILILKARILLVDVVCCRLQHFYVLL